MANMLFTTWKGTILSSANSSCELVSNTTQAGIYAALISTTVGVVTSTWEQFSDFSSAMSGAISSEHRLVNPTVSSATFDSSDVTFPSVAAGSTIVAVLVMRLQNSDSATCLPVAYIDTATGLPLTPNGGNVTVTWDSAGIFTISEAAVKENLAYLGHVGPAHLYEFNYIGEETRQVGMIASDVQVWCPEAIKVVDGMRRVNYATAMDKAAKIQLTEVS